MHRVALCVSKPRSVLHLPMFLGNLNEYCIQFQQIDAFHKVSHITVRNESYYVPGYIYITIYVYTSYYQVMFILPIIRSTLKATVILLPLLGLTWVFGVLTIDHNTTVFAWLFTICNSTQVCNAPGGWLYMFHMKLALSKLLIANAILYSFHLHFQRCVIYSAWKVTAQILFIAGSSDLVLPCDQK